MILAPLLLSIAISLPPEAKADTGALASLSWAVDSEPAPAQPTSEAPPTEASPPTSASAQQVPANKVEPETEAETGTQQQAQPEVEEESASNQAAEPKKRKRKYRLLKEREQEQGPSVSLVISGVQGALYKNIELYLSPLPTTRAERNAFAFTLQERVEEALSALGYYNADIDIDVDRSVDRWPINITVKAGDPVTYRHVMIWLEGDASGDPMMNQLVNNASIKPGQVLHHGRYQSLKNSLLSEGLIRGYFDAKFAVAKLEVDRDNNLADLLLVYDSGTRYQLGEVSFSEFDLEPQLLDAMVPFEPGDPYSSAAVARLNSNLLSAGYFRDVRVLPQTDQSQDYRVPVDIQLTPASRHTVDLGVGYTTDTGPRATTTWRTPKINRAGHSQELSIELSKNPQMNFNYRIPLDHPMDDQLIFSALIERDKFGNLESDQYGLRVARQTRMDDGWLRNYYLRGLQEQWQFDGDNLESQLLLPGISWSKTKRWGSPLDPRRGFRQIYTVEHADTSLGSDVRLTQIKGQFKWVDTPWDQHRFVLRFDGGLTKVDNADLEQVPPSMRFFAGGDTSIRGFSYQSQGPTKTIIDNNGTPQQAVVGGRYLLVGSLEYQYYVNDSWRLATFVDGGNAFNTNDFEPVYSVGVGLHWLSPVGPIKADFGYGISEDKPPFRLHLTIGADL
ncbi:autotransporter assembly complex family protein [Ferrimonas sp. SCSIO 43195]|uniref:autotransporter assembly complex protein TamA n=1 Tax=Ferrimonas sp. SCSIO 43195 TaxID=2822844 RepID=UPI00207661AE|nr:BamA/TamA family outer membrane protein [Ferrimonas sp. SCSIO 43195]USD36219.1 BamA/TamA family outer membrane protein [Ferrimonas sp. SCSIO 43195]